MEGRTLTHLLILRGQKGTLLVAFSASRRPTPSHIHTVSLFLLFLWSLLQSVLSSTHVSVIRVGVSQSGLSMPPASLRFFSFLIYSEDGEGWAKKSFIMVSALGRNG